MEYPGDDTIILWFWISIYMFSVCVLDLVKTRVITVFVSPCVGGSKAPPCTLYGIKCVLAEQFIQTANYYNFLTSCSNRCKTSDGIPR